MQQTGAVKLRVASVWVSLAPVFAAWSWASRSWGGEEGWVGDILLPGAPMEKICSWAAPSRVLASSTHVFGYHKIFIVSIFTKLARSSPCRIGYRLQKHLSGPQLVLSEELNWWGTQAHPSSSAPLAAPAHPCVGPAGGVVAARSPRSSERTCLGAVDSLSKQL